MTILQIIQEFCKRTGLAVPTVVATSNNKTFIQLMSLSNELLDDLSINRVQWTAQLREATFTSVNDEIQGSLSTIAPGFLSMVEDSFYDRTANIIIKGPVTAAEWQNYLSSNTTSAYSKYRISNNILKLIPAPAAGHSMYFEYKSKYLVISSDLSYKQYFTVDSDVCSLDSTIILLGLRYLWRREKELNYGDAFNDYERAVSNLSSKENSPLEINMGDGSLIRKPGIIVPDSNWSL